MPKTLLQPRDFFHSQPYGLRLKEMGISHGLKSVRRTLFARLRRGGLSIPVRESNPRLKFKKALVYNDFSKSVSNGVSNLLFFIRI